MIRRITWIRLDDIFRCPSNCILQVRDKLCVSNTGVVIYEAKKNYLSIRGTSMGWHWNFESYEMVTWLSVYLLDSVNMEGCLRSTVKKLISNRGFLKLSFDIGCNTLETWYEYENFYSGFRSAEISACGGHVEIDGAMGTLSVNGFEQADCWTPNGLGGSMPTVLTCDCGWYWVELPGTILFSVFLSFCPLGNGKEGMLEVW